MQGSINFDGSLVGNITGGGGDDTVVITPVVTSGTKIADVSVNGVEKDLYCPTPTAVSVTQVQQSGTKIATIGVNGVNTDIYTPEGGGSDVEITPVVTSGTKIADVSVGGVEKDLYTPDYGADIAALDGRLDIAEDNITSLTGRVGTAEGNITNLAGHMTEAETDITEIKQSLSDLTTLTKTASGTIVTFDDGSDLPMPKLEVAIEPHQEGNGDPSPTNIRPISGWDKVNVTVADDVETPTVSNVYTIDLDGTRYGGTLDVVSGVLTVDRTSIKLSDLTWTKQNTINNNWRFKSSQSIQNIKIPIDASQKIDNLCSVYQTVTANETWTADKTGITVNADGTLLICDLNQANTTALGVVIANQTIVYELATPITVQLTPTQIKSLLGVNNIWADTGDLELTYFVNNSLVYAIYDMIKSIYLIK